MTRAFAPRYRKLDAFDVQAIFAWAGMGRRSWEIAPKFGVSEAHVRNVLQGRRKVSRET